MKNAIKFNYAKYNTLTDDEWNELEKLIVKICDSHDNDKWWKVDNGIRACVDCALIRREADEELEELKERDDEDEE